MFKTATVVADSVCKIDGQATLPLMTLVLGAARFKKPLAVTLCREWTLVRVMAIDAVGWIGRFTVSRLQLAGAEVCVAGMCPQMIERFFPPRRGAAPVRAAEGLDFDDLGALRRVLTGLDAVVSAPEVFSNGFRSRLGRLIGVASDVGLSHVVQICASDATRDCMAFHDEADLQSSGLPFTILQPALMDSTIVEHASGIRDRGAWVGSAPRGLNTFIDPRDVVACAAAVVLQAKPLGPLHLSGPERLSYKDVAALLSDVLHREIAYQVVEPEAQLITLQSQGMSFSQACRCLARDGITEAQANPALNEMVLHLTQRPAGTLANYLEDHRCIFTGGELVE